jgi:hypothetical protein
MRYEDALDLLLARIRQGMPVQQALAGFGAGATSLQLDYAALSSVGGLSAMFPAFTPTSAAWARVQGALDKELGGTQMNTFKLAPIGIALAALMASSAIVMASNEGGFTSVVLDFVRPGQEQEVLSEDLDGDGLPDLPPPDGGATGGESADSPETTDTIDDDEVTPDTEDVAVESITGASTVDATDDVLSPVSPVSPVSPASPVSPLSVESPATPPATGGTTAVSADSPDTPVNGTISAESPDTPANGGTTGADSPESPPSPVSAESSDNDNSGSSGSSPDSGD